jgi:predicted  nucleic acid-binding Zn-ribbon protein
LCFSHGSTHAALYLSERRAADKEQEKLAAQLDAAKSTAKSLEAARKAVEKEAAALEREKERVELETVRLEEQRKAMEAKRSAFEEAKKFKEEEQSYKVGRLAQDVALQVAFERRTLKPVFSLDRC